MRMRESPLAAVVGTFLLLVALLLAVGTGSGTQADLQPGATTGSYWPFQAKITESTTEGSTLVSGETSLFAGAAWDEYVRVLLTVDDEQGPVSRSNWGSTLVVDGREVLHGWLQDGAQLTPDLATDSLFGLVEGFATGSLNVTRDVLPADAARQAPAALFTDFWTETEAVDEARLPAAEASGETAAEARSVAERLGLPLDDLFVNRASSASRAAGLPHRSRCCARGACRRGHRAPGVRIHRAARRGAVRTAFWRGVRLAS